LRAVESERVLDTVRGLEVVREESDGRVTWVCPACGDRRGSTRALSSHLGRAHPEWL